MTTLCLTTAFSDNAVEEINSFLTVHLFDCLLEPPVAKSTTARPTTQARL